MNELWTRYVGWLGAHFPEGRRALLPAASEAEIGGLESAVGAKLPDDYRSLLRMHNGQEPESVGLLWSNEFLSTSRVLEEWQLMKQLQGEGHFPHPSSSMPQGAIQSDWWHPLWIPITSDGSGNLECLDLAPGPLGTAGQVIDFDHETVHRCVLATSFREALQGYVQRVLAGEYAYSDDYGRLMPVDEL